MEDSDLVLAAKKGDLNAFNELVLKYQNQVYNFASRLLNNHDIAEDITQEAFILAFRKIHQFRGGSFRAWLFKIVKNLCYSELRTWRRRTFQGLEPINMEGEENESPQWIKDPQPLPEDEVEANDLRNRLEYTLNELPNIYRVPLTLIDIQELDYMEAASVLGVPIGTVKSRLARGRMQFRKILNGMEMNWAIIGGNVNENENGFVVDFHHTYLSCLCDSSSDSSPVPATSECAHH